MDDKKTVVVVGAGALGAWTAWYLTQAGCEVTLVEMVAPGHVVASSGGETRVIRAVYGEGKHYTAMISEAMEAWKDLQQAMGQSLYHETGVLWLHQEDGSYLEASKPHLEHAGFSLQPLELDELKYRFPALEIEGIRGAYFEPQAGVLMARQACQSLVNRCKQAGVRYVKAQAIPGLSKGDLLKTLNLDLGHLLHADQFVFACGPWLKGLFPSLLNNFLITSRQEVCFFRSPEGRSRLDWRGMPVWIEFGEAIYYGLPDVAGGGLKVALDERGAPIDPDKDDRDLSKETVSLVRQFLAKRFPTLAKEPLIQGKVCQYTNTPDGELLADRHPAYRNVWLLGGGSGHAFKLAPVVGRMITRQILGESTGFLPWKLAHRLDVDLSRTQFQHTTSQADR